MMSWYGNGLHITDTFVMGIQESPMKSSNTRSRLHIFDVFFVVSLNNMLNQQSSFRWLETPYLYNVIYLNHSIALRESVKCHYLLFCISLHVNTHCTKTYVDFNQLSPRLQQLLCFLLCLVPHGFYNEQKSYLGKHAHNPIIFTHYLPQKREKKYFTKYFTKEKH